MASEWISELSRALTHEVPYEDARRWVTGGTPSAVLSLWAMGETGPEVLLTRRSESLAHHRGQIAFPGGVCEKTDGGPEFTALRESREEIGLEDTGVRVLGKLPDLPTTTGFRITPVLAAWEIGSPTSLLLRPSANEIAEVFWVSRAQLEVPGVYRREPLAVGPLRVQVPVFQVGEYRIWGATAAILRNVLDRLKENSK